jgi:hypothetical protein
VQVLPELGHLQESRHGSAQLSSAATGSR